MTLVPIGFIFIFFVLAIIFLYFRKKKKIKFCREYGCSIIKDNKLKTSFIDMLQDIAAFQRQSYTDINMYEMISLNFRGQNAYFAEVICIRGHGLNRKREDWHTFILESKETLPYIKIVPNTNFINIITNKRLQFLRKPANTDLGEIKIDEDYSLYCAPEYAQAVLDILPGILSKIKEGKYIVEISGKWIVVMRWWSYTSFDKFIDQTLPIAKVFDEKRL